MRRYCVLALMLLGLLTIIIGFAEAYVHPATLPVAHIVVALLLVLVSLVHITINRRAVVRYIRGK